MECPTVQIQIAPSAENPTGVVVINEEDYDAATMQLVGGEPPAPMVTQEVQTLTTSDVGVLSTTQVAALAAVAPPWANK